MSYKSYKGRKLDLTKPVKIYKNLHNGLFSIKQSGVIVGHIDKICLTDVKFKVSEAGRQRVIKEKQKNVHAFVVGVVKVFSPLTKTNASRVISYNPYKFSYFYFKDNEEVAVLNNDETLFMDSQQGLWVEK